MRLSADQRAVVLGIAAAVLFSAGFVWLGVRFGPFEAPTAASAAERLVYALRCDFWAGFALLAAVARIAAQRFFSGEIDGSQPARSAALQVNRAVLQNTTEQLLLLLVAHAGLALALDGPALRVVPVLVSLFLIGRIAFWAGYQRSPPTRAFGFAATFYPTVAAFLFAAVSLAASG